MVDKSPARIRAMFDQISPRYDFLNHLLSLNSDVVWRRRAAELLGPVRTVLDVCCGTADLAIAVRRRWGARVVGVDFSKEMLVRARRKTRAELLQGDALRLPFRSERFDAVTFAFGIRNVANPQHALAEMARVLRPGGKALILEFTLPIRPAIRRGYLFYFSQVLPRIGKMLARAEIDAYRYLPDSVQRWFSPEELSEELRGTGFREVRHYPLSLGVAAIHIGVKP